MYAAAHGNRSVQSIDLAALGLSVLPILSAARRIPLCGLAPCDAASAVALDHATLETNTPVVAGAFSPFLPGQTQPSPFVLRSWRLRLLLRDKLRTLHKPGYPVCRCTSGSAVDGAASSGLADAATLNSARILSMDLDSVGTTDRGCMRA